MTIFYSCNKISLQQFPSIVINHTLAAMTLGSTRARELFPRLLQLIELYPDTLNLLVEKASVTAIES